MRRKIYSAADEKLAAVQAKKSADNGWKYVFQEFQKGSASKEDLCIAMDRSNSIDREILNKYGHLDIS